MNRQDKEAYAEWLEEREREERELRERAAAELGRMVLGGGEVRGTTILGGGPVVSPGENISGEDIEVEESPEPVGSPVGSADAGAHGIRPRRARTAGEEIY